MKSSDVKAIVFELLSQQSGQPSGEITGDLRIVADLGLDSLDCSELVMKLEEQFGLSIPDEDMERLSTVGGLLVYVEHKLGQKGVGVMP